MDHLWNDEPNDHLYQQIEQFVLDPQFRAWVLRPTPELEVYWTDYLSLGLPDRDEAVRQARLVVLALQMPDYPVSPETVQAKTDQLLHRVRSGGEPLGQRSAGAVRRLYPIMWRWVAAATVLLTLGWWGFSTYTAQTSGPVGNQIETSMPLAELSGTVVEESTTQTTRRVTLPDGSVVTLQPHSQLRYSKDFGSPSRTVTLTGQAFFEVMRNPIKPFLVFTDDVVTRVLGTSFTVTTRQGQPAIVSVRTGRVAVYTRQAFAQATDQPKESLLLLPNQQATFDKTAGELTRKLVTEPLPIPTELPHTLNFENRPVTEVITELEKIYGVQIACDRERLSRCRVTVLLENEPLFDQLTLLCKLIDGRYERTDTTVTLTANGCE